MDPATEPLRLVARPSRSVLVSPKLVLGVNPAGCAAQRLPLGRLPQNPLPLAPPSSGRPPHENLYIYIYVFVLWRPEKHEVLTLSSNMLAF